MRQLSDEQAHQACEFPWRQGNLSYVELCLDNMGHVLEHGAQLSMFLGQRAGRSTGWVARARGE